MTFPQVGHQGLTENDFEPVKDLIAEVRRRENLLKAIVTWQNAFTIFKKLERRNGLPKNERENTVYLAIVSDLRCTGYWLLEFISEHQEQARMADAGLSISALRACIAELEVDDRAVFLEEDTDLMKRLESSLGR